MKKDDAEALHQMLFQRWLREHEPKRNEQGLLSFQDYLTYARQQNRDCLDFRCRGGAHYQVQRWFEALAGQSFVQ